MKLSRISIMIIVLVLFCFQSVTISDDQNPGKIDFTQFTHLKSKYDARIKFPVPYLLEKYNANLGTDEEFSSFADSIGFKAKGNKVQVVIELDEGAEELITANEVKRYELENTVFGKKWLKCYIPVNKLERIIDEFPEIKQIRQVRLAKNTAITSEGFSLVGAPNWHSAGYTGSGIKVAIIDSGFQYLSTFITNGDFTSNYTGVDFTGSGFPGTYYHGTECAAIVYDFVPNAEFYLIIISDDNDFEQAKDYCIANDIDVISMSLGWNGYWYGDGQGGVCAIANELADNGILVVNSAGNEAENYYWHGSWKDSDTDDLMEFSGIDETNSIDLSRREIISLRLTWDTSYTSDQDYDMHLLDSSGNVVASSTNFQTGTQQPLEIINYRANRDATYHVVIQNYNAIGSSNFRLYCSKDFGLEYADSSNSIVDPGTSLKVFTVGAIRHDYWNNSPVPIEYFSSQGPNSLGAVKPDICGPDGTISTYYGDFYGTSASCPHVAGAAAIYWSSQLSSNASDVRTYLEGNALDCGLPGKDNTFGHGKLNLPPPGSATVPGKVTLSSPTNNATDQQLTVNLQWQKPSGLPTEYQLQYSNDGFNTNSTVVNNITTESYQLSGLSNSTTYSWQVRAYNSVGWGEWSDIWYFTTINPPVKPGQVTLISPSNNATDQPTTITLQWNTPSGTAPFTYHLQVASDSGFSSIVYENLSIPNTSQQVSGLSNSTTYYWQVRAHNSVDWGLWSAKWQFSTIPPAATPGQVTLVSPANNATDQKSNIVFQWDTPTGTAPFTYHLQVSTDIGFSLIIYDNDTISTTSQRVSGLLKSTTYYWRVRAGNVADWGPLSSEWQFRTK